MIDGGRPSKPPPLVYTYIYMYIYYLCMRENATYHGNAAVETSIANTPMLH